MLRDSLSTPLSCRKIFFRQEPKLRSEGGLDSRGWLDGRRRIIDPIRAVVGSQCGTAGRNCRVRVELRPDHLRSLAHGDPKVSFVRPGQRTPRANFSDLATTTETVGSDPANDVSPIVGCQERQAPVVR